MAATRSAEDEEAPHAPGKEAGFPFSREDIRITVFVQPCLYLSPALLCVFAPLREAQAFSLARSLHSLKPQRSPRKAVTLEFQTSLSFAHLCFPLRSLRLCESNAPFLSLADMLTQAAKVSRHQDRQNRRKGRPVIRVSLFWFISVSCKGGTVCSLFSYPPRMIRCTYVPFVKKLRAFGGCLTLPVSACPAPSVSSPQFGV